MNFLMFLQIINAAAPLIGKTVEALHPNDAPEAVKIDAGVQLLNLVSAAAVAAASTPQPAAGAPSQPASVSITPGPVPEVATAG